MKANGKFRQFVENKQANTGAAVMAIIFLIVGVAVSSLLMIFTTVLGGQTYQLVEDDIDAITCTTIQGYIKEGIMSTFQAQAQVGNYLPIIVLAVIITIIIGLIVGGIAGQFTGMGGYNQYGGGGVL